MMGYINSCLCKINDKISFRKHLSLENRYFFNGFAKNSFHNVIIESRMIKFTFIPTPQYFITILNFSLFFTNLCKLLLQTTKFINIVKVVLFLRSIIMVFSFFYFFCRFFFHFVLSFINV